MDSEEDGNNVWRNFVRQAMTNLPENVGNKEDTSAEEFLKEPIVSQVLESLKKEYENFRTLREDFRSSEGCQGLGATKKAIQDKEATIPADEAYSNAWEKRKFLVLKILTENVDIIQEYMSDQDDDNNGNITVALLPVDIIQFYFQKRIQRNQEKNRKQTHGVI